MTSSTVSLIGAVLPLRRAPSTVISVLASENSIRSLTDSALKPPKHDVVDRADARAGEHRHRDLGDHRQVDRDDVALAHAERRQRVGELLDVAVQVGVGDVELFALLTAPVVGHAVAVAGLDVPVDAVVGDVELAADEPLRERRVRPVQHLVPLGVPVERFGALRPEGLVVLGLLVDRIVRDDRLLLEALRRSERLLVQQLLELVLERRHAISSLGVLRTLLPLGAARARLGLLLRSCRLRRRTPFRPGLRGRGRRRPRLSLTRSPRR